MLRELPTAGYFEGQGDQVGVSCLHPLTINRTIKAMAGAAGLDQVVITQLSGHSMRVGAAQDMMASGIGILPVMQAGESYRQILVTAGPVRRRRLWADGRSAWR